ncbi:MAG: SET domain-containing protein-lysine N-methyltransferase [Candidatus Altiarchaeales archaeon]|nr:SET domain-containing protein-lysine N-methyltransferase [Candidatus Altiarchaeales archaeon]MBD3416810.1 SET domain-containing protein-lysine N-methyltransferase [Candidatus Altiarchaeales archaeon]
MFFIKAEVRASRIADEGVFTLEDIAKGQVVGNLGVGVKAMTEGEYHEGQRKGSELVIRTGARWVSDQFLHKGIIEDEEYLNHSFDPNLLYHLGMLFAKRDIKSGEELTVNYEYLLAEDDEFSFCDSGTGRKVDGLDGYNALARSAKELVDVLI